MSRCVIGIDMTTIDTLRGTLPLKATSAMDFL